MRRFQDPYFPPNKGENPAVQLRRALGGAAEVLEPSDCEEPILSAPVRSAVFGWLAELNARAELAKVGVKPRSAALLVGPPGCGKTTLAHHLAARLGVPMVSVGAENLISSALGGSEQKIAGLFHALGKLADAGAPAVLFMDEIDAVGGKRKDASGDTGGAVSAMNSSLTVLLRKVESFKGIFIAATNRGDSLDHALWRRFGMQIEVEIPDAESRWAILNRYGTPYSFSVETLDAISAVTIGAAPSLLRGLMEGVKRQIILGAKRYPNFTPSIAGTFAVVVAQTRPHPELTPPPLWEDPRGALETLSRAHGNQVWPPVLRSKH